VFSFIVSTLSPSRFTSFGYARSYMSHSISAPPDFLDLPNGITKVKLKSSGDEASPCFKPFWIGKP
jgi:hypothetical protein